MARPEILFILKCQKANYDLLDLEEAVVLAGLTVSASQAFTARHLQVPEWLLDQEKALERFIKVKTEEELELRLKRLEAKRTQLMTPTEQREKVDQEIAALRAAIGESV